MRIMEAHDSEFCRSPTIRTTDADTRAGGGIKKVAKQTGLDAVFSTTPHIKSVTNRVALPLKQILNFRDYYRCVFNLWLLGYPFQNFSKKSAACCLFFGIAAKSERI